MADKPPTAMPAASEPFPGSRTPGWNDPPTLPYNAISSSGTIGQRTRLNLNKRVAYPLQGTINAELSGATAKPTAIVTPNQSSQAPLQPPPPINNTNAQPIAVVHPMPHMVSQTETANLPHDARISSFENLRQQINYVQESTNVKRDEIERRLGIIEQLWQSGNLSVGLQEKIYHLSQAVARKQYTDAMDIYTSLVVNHSNECASWAVTLRHIVLTLEHGSSDISTVPTMFVPAMPRPNNNDGITDGQSNISRVQHI